MCALRHSLVSDSATPCTGVSQASLSMEFSQQEYWSVLALPSPGDRPNPGIKPMSPALQTDSLPSEPPGKPQRIMRRKFFYFSFLIGGKLL